MGNKYIKLIFNPLREILKFNFTKTIIENK
jgi:hypothetical protein